MKLKKLFDPRSVAIIGASETSGKVGNIIFENLVKGGYKGKIYPINPKYKKIDKIKCYSTVLDIEDEIDMAIVAIPAGVVPQSIKECAWRARPIKNIVIISAGFSESGEKGSLLEKEIKELAGEYGLNIVGPNCLGIVNSKIRLNASFAKRNIKEGKIGLVMQSGAFTTALVDLAENNNLGFSSIVTLGNKAVLDEVDFIDYFKEDEETRLVVFYLESINRGRVFMEEIAGLSGKKPVFVLKAGNSKKVQTAIQSHTGAMAGEFEVAKKGLEEGGCLLFESIAGLFQTLKFFNGFRLPRNNKTVVITNAGGPGVITTDLIERTKNIEMLDLAVEEKKMIKGKLPPACSAENPIDVLGDADSSRYESVLSILSRNEKVGSAIILVTPQAQTDIEQISQVIIKANKKSPFPILPVFLGGPAGVLAENSLSGAGLSNFNFPSEAICALDKANEFAFKKKFQSLDNIEIKTSQHKRSEKILCNIIKEKRNGFYYQEACALASLYGLESEGALYLGSTKDILNISDDIFPVVAKIDDPAILHKNDKGGICLNIMNKEDLRKAFDDLKANFNDSKIIIQKQLPAGLEIILGIKKDPQFGMVVLCGLGGIFAEIIEEKSLWFAPVGRQKIESELADSKIRKVLEKNKIKIEVLIEEIKKLSQLAAENEWIKELDINPMIFYKDKAPIAVDIKGIVKTK